MQALLWKRCTTAYLRTQTRACCTLHQVSCAGFIPPCAFIASHYGSLVPVCPSCFPVPVAVTAAHSPRENDGLQSTMQGVHRACRLSGEQWLYLPFHLPTPASLLFRMLEISHKLLYVCMPIAVILAVVRYYIKLSQIILLASQFPQKYILNLGKINCPLKITESTAGRQWQVSYRTYLCQMVEQFCRNQLYSRFAQGVSCANSTQAATNPPARV